MWPLGEAPAAQVGMPQGAATTLKVRPFSRPADLQGWQKLAKTMKTATPSQYPSVSPEDFEAFKSALARAASPGPLQRLSANGPGLVVLLGAAVVFISGANLGAIGFFGLAILIMAGSAFSGYRGKSMTEAAYAQVQAMASDRGLM